MAPKFPTFVFLILSFELVVGPKPRFGNSETNFGTPSSSDHNANLAGSSAERIAQSSTALTNQELPTLNLDPRVTTDHLAKLHVIRGNIVEQDVLMVVNAANNRLVKGGGVDHAIHMACTPQRRKLVTELAKKRKDEFSKLFEAEFTQTGEAGVADMIKAEVRNKYEAEMAQHGEGELGNMFEAELAQISDRDLAKKYKDEFAKISKADMAKLFEWAFAQIDEGDWVKKCRAEFVKKNEAEMPNLFEYELAKIGETKKANKFKAGLTKIDDAELAKIREENGFALPDGSVVVTSAYGELRNKMNVEYIAHAVGSDLRPTREPTPENRNALQACYQRALDQLLQLETHGRRSKTIVSRPSPAFLSAFLPTHPSMRQWQPWKAMLNWLATTPNSEAIEEIRLIIWEGDKQNEKIYNKLIEQVKRQLEKW